MLYEIIGWAGTLAILLAYFLVSFHKISSGSREYQLLNLFGAIGLLINTAFHRVIPSAALNLVWLLIALYALYQIAKK